MSVKIVVQSIEDANNGMRIKDDVTKENIEEVDHITMGILEKGTKGGQTTIMFVVETKDGKNIISQCTGREFEAMYFAWKGADERFNDK